MGSGLARHGDDAVFCAHLAAGATIAVASAAAGFSGRTGRRRAQEPEVLETVQRLTDEFSAAVTAELVGLARRSVRYLGEVIDNPAAADNVRVRAAQIVLAMTVRYQEHSVERRLVALEQARLEQERVAALLNSFLGEGR